MPKDWFRVSAMTPLSDVAAGGRIHFIGVCGVAMGQLAVALSEMGYQVSGSDKAFYEPMGSFLKESSVKLFQGYQADNVPEDVDLVVIGNAISYGHEEAACVEEKNLPYTCFSQLLHEVVIAGKTSIVCCGTHGKSTTTAMTHHILKELGRNPSFFVGGVIAGEPRSLVRTSGTESVVEGDEYDSAFFAKVPKFSFYAPDIAIINALEFDHADIYDSIDAIEAEFVKLVALLPDSGTLLCCIDFPRLKELLPQWKQKYSCRMLSFGMDPDADIRIVNRTTSGLSQQFEVHAADFDQPVTVNLPANGMFNARNATAALSAVCCLGVHAQEAALPLASFGKVKRRLEVRIQRDDVVLIEDFAHHPTSVHCTIEAVREAFPDYTLWAVFEPRSNTSRRRIFQNDYMQAFSLADRGILCAVTARSHIDQGKELLDVEQLASDISTAGTPCVALENADSILHYLLKEKTGKDVFLIMSNGSFDNLNQKLDDSLSE